MSIQKNGKTYRFSINDLLVGVALGVLSNFLYDLLKRKIPKIYVFLAPRIGNAIWFVLREFTGSLLSVYMRVAWNLCLARIMNRIIDALLAICNMYDQKKHAESRYFIFGKHRPFFRSYVNLASERLRAFLVRKL